MIKVKESISYRTYGKVGRERIEICAEGYRLENDIEIMFIDGKWVDSKNNEFTAVNIGKIVGFNQKNTLTKADKSILRLSPEGMAYIEYNEKIGGDNLGLNVPWGYPPRVQRYLDEGHTLKEVYRECIEAGISWEERFGCYIDSVPEVNDSFVIEI